MPRAYHTSPAHQPPRLLRLPRVSLAKLVRSSWATDRKTSRSVRLRDVKQVNPPRGLSGWQVWKGRTHTADNRHQHTVRVFWQGENEAFTPRTKIVVDCTCHRHLFYYEYANAQQGASFLYRSNGNPASTTNPRSRLGMCKHAIRCTEYLLQQLKDGRRIGAPSRTRG